MYDAVHLLSHKCTLYKEHELLGATFAPDDCGVMCVTSYPCNTVNAHDDAAFQAGTSKAAPQADAMLCDNEDATLLLVAGTEAENFLTNTCTNALPKVGAIAPHVILSEDGTAVSCIFVACFDDRPSSLTYCIIDTSPRSTLTLSSVCARATQKKPLTSKDLFDDLRIDGIGRDYIALSLFGTRAQELLSDYVKAPEKLPQKPLTCEYVHLDERIQCFVLCLAPEYYLMILSKDDVEVIWRSLLSFSFLMPCVRSEAFNTLSEEYPYLARFTSEDECSFTPEELTQYALVRSDHTFFGAEALYRQKK